MAVYTTSNNVTSGKISNIRYDMITVHIYLNNDSDLHSRRDKRKLCS